MLSEINSAGTPVEEIRRGSEGKAGLAASSRQISLSLVVLEEEGAVERDIPSLVGLVPGPCFGPDPLIDHSQWMTQKCQ